MPTENIVGIVLGCVMDTGQVYWLTASVSVRKGGRTMGKKTAAQLISRQPCFNALVPA